MAEPANTPAEPKPETECGDGLVYDPESGECVPKADADVTQSSQPAAAAEKGIGGYIGAIDKTFNDWFTNKMREFDERVNKTMDETLKRVQKEFAAGLRKQMGLSNDPTVTKTELDSAIRKAVIDLKINSGKKTPAGPALQKGEPEKPKAGDVFKNYGAA
jgi:hypothetical protein